MTVLGALTAVIVGLWLAVGLAILAQWLRPEPEAATVGRVE